MSGSTPFLKNEQLLEVFSLTKTATAIHVGEDAIIQTANDAMLAIWGKNKSVIGKSLEEALPELKGQPFIAMFKKVWNEGLIISGSDTMADLNIGGTIQSFYFDFEYRAVKDEQGKTICILHSATDVTDRFLKSEALKRATEKEQALSNEQALNEELAAANEELFSTNEELQQTQESLHTLNNELEEKVNERVKDLDESIKREQAANEELAASNEELLSLNEELSITIDHLNQSQDNLQQANMQLRYSEQLLDDILQLLPSPIVVLRGANYIIELANQSMLAYWGKNKNEVIGKPILDVFPEFNNQPFPGLWKQVLETGETIIRQERPVYFNMPAGGKKLLYVDVFYKPLSNLNGIRTGVLSSIIDVTEKVTARKLLEENQVSLNVLVDELSAINEEIVASNEEIVASNEELISTNEELSMTQQSLQRMFHELAASEGRFRILVEQAPVAIAVYKTHELVIDIVNNRMLEVWGRASDIIGKTLAEAMPELDGQPFIKVLQDVFTSGKPYYGNESKAYFVRNGELVEGYFNFICQPIKDESDNIISVLQVVSEITEQVQIRLEMQKTEEMMRFAVEAAKLGSWHIHPVTKSLKYNSTLTRIFGYEGIEDMTYEQAIGQVTADYRDKIVAEIEKAVTDGGAYDITYTQQRFNDGEVIWLRSLGKVSQDENGNFTVFSGFVMDITEQKHDEQRKNDFIGMVSHELKTPLTSLSAYIQMLHSKAKKAEDPFLTGVLDKVNLQVKKMTGMINGFLNISRLESGKILLAKHEFKLDELIEELIEETRLIAPGFIIILNMSDPITVNADEEKIGSVISNLLSNAVKYSAKGKNIGVQCKVLGNSVQVSFKDEGMGIKQEDIKHLFDRYYRVEDPNFRHISGFGIGLYLSAEIIHRHGGTIWVESEIGKGSVFYFTLPKN